jgi:hypothetical protein
MNTSANGKLELSGVTEGRSPAARRSVTPASRSISARSTKSVATTNATPMKPHATPTTVASQSVRPRKRISGEAASRAGSRMLLSEARA